MPPKIPDRDMREMVRVRKNRKRLSGFSVSRLGEGGPMVIYQQCSFTTPEFRENYDQIVWKDKD